MEMRRTAAAVAAALACTAVLADEGDRVTLSAFGTLGAVRTNTDLGRYATSVLQPSGAARAWDFTIDSLIAGQADIKATRDLSFTVQVVANKTADDDFEPHAEWAFARYAVTPQLQVRGGILAVPIFMLSDSRLIGFSYPWVRVPTAVNSQVPVTNFTGVDVVYRPSVGNTIFTLQPYYGEAHPQVPSSTTAGTSTKSDLKPMAGINVAVENGPWTARAGYLYTRFSYHTDTVNALFAGARSIDRLVPGAAALADELEANDKKITFAGVGAAYDGRDIFAQAEYGRRKAELFLADTSAWYATLGYRFGSVMPHVTFSQVRTDSPTTQRVIPAVGALAPLAAGINSLLAGQNPAQKAVALGVRWQFARNADFKAQWDRVKIPAGAQGNFQQVQPGFPGTVNVYSAAVDFVF